MSYEVEPGKMTSMGDNLIPDQITAAIGFAEFVMKKEKRDRIGLSEDTVCPMKFFFFHDGKTITGLMGSPFGETDIDEKDVMSLTARLFAIALDARAVLHVMEGWMANRCAKCGASASETKDQRCGICGAEVVPPSENPHGEEMLICTLSVKGVDKTYFWTSRFQRDDGGKIVGFYDQLKCQPMEAEGRFTQIWSLETWMGPHFAINIPVIMEALGKKVEDRHRMIARKAKEMAPPGYKFIKLNVHDLASAITRMKLKGKAEEN